MKNTVIKIDTLDHLKLIKDGAKVALSLTDTRERELSMVSDGVWVVTDSGGGVQLDATSFDDHKGDIYVYDGKLPLFTQKSKATVNAQSSDARSMQMNFGKYKGSTLSDIVAKDRKYLEWCVTSFDDKSFMKPFIKEILEAKVTK